MVTSFSQTTLILVQLSPPQNQRTIRSVRRRCSHSTIGKWHPHNSRYPAASGKRKLRWHEFVEGYSWFPSKPFSAKQNSTPRRITLKMATIQSANPAANSRCPSQLASGRHNWKHSSSRLQPRLPIHHDVEPRRVKTGLPQVHEKPSIGRHIIINQPSARLEKHDGAPRI